MKELIDTLYAPRIARVREMVSEAPILRRMLARDIDAGLLERFLIEYCSLGVRITEPVEGWIDRAGRRCGDIGLTEVGSLLCSHAAHEAGHHRMFIADTERLVAMHNRRGVRSLSSEALIARPPTRAMAHYIELHEETISSDLPAAQVAIELEIERLSVVLVPDILAQVRRVLGEATADALGFLKEHAALDVGHTHFNERLMNTLLQSRPDAAGDLARVGAEALLIYMNIFEDCWALAVEAVRQTSQPPLSSGWAL